MLKLTMQKFKWMSIYIVGAIAGLFVGGNLLAENVGGFVYDLTHKDSHTNLLELDELILALFGAIAGVVISVVLVTLIKSISTRKR